MTSQGEGMFLLVTARGLVVAQLDGEAVWLPELPALPSGGAATVGPAVKIVPGSHVVEVTGEFLEAHPGYETLRPVDFAHDRVVTRGVALWRNRKLNNFHPSTGEELTYTSGNIVGRTPAGLEVFPRLDPAVIGVVTHREYLLLGRNAQRSGFFSLPAGYVDVGETLEEAFTREVLEETGRRVHDVRYWGSQPWAASGSIMLGFWGQTNDLEPVAETDGELTEIRWVTRAELPRVPLAAPGSIAHRMIMEWYNSGA